MKSVQMICFAMLLWALSYAPAQAFFPPCSVPFVVGYEMRPVICYRPEWREERVPCVIQKVNYRREVKQVPTRVWVPKVFDENVRTSYYMPVPKVVERDVQTCVMVPVTMCDPCTGCCYVSGYPQWVVQRVRCTEYDYRREDRDVPVKVCRMVAQDTMVEQVNWIPEVRQENSWTVRRYCVMVAYQTNVCVPVYVPCCP